jgi:hypothetical protein
MYSCCRCSDCHISSTLFPRDCEGRIILPSLSEDRKQLSPCQIDLDKEGCTSKGLHSSRVTSTRDVLGSSLNSHTRTITGPLTSIVEQARKIIISRDGSDQHMTRVNHQCLQKLEKMIHLPRVRRCQSHSHSPPLVSRNLRLMRSGHNFAHLCWRRRRTEPCMRTVHQSESGGTRGRVGRALLYRNPMARSRASGIIMLHLLGQNPAELH